MTKTRVVVLTSEVEESTSLRAREGAARRRLVATTGQCPCGAVLELPNNPRPGTVALVAIEHEPDCPATETTR